MHLNMMYHFNILNNHNYKESSNDSTNIYQIYSLLKDINININIKMETIKEIEHLQYVNEYLERQINQNKEAITKIINNKLSTLITDTTKDDSYITEEFIKTIEKQFPHLLEKANIKNLKCKFLEKQFLINANTCAYMKGENDTNDTCPHLEQLVKDKATECPYLVALSNSAQLDNTQVLQNDIKQYLKNHGVTECLSSLKKIKEIQSMCPHLAKTETTENKCPFHH